MEASAWERKAAQGPGLVTEDPTARLKGETQEENRVGAQRRRGLPGGGSARSLECRVDGKRMKGRTITKAKVGRWPSRA